MEQFWKEGVPAEGGGGMLIPLQLPLNSLQDVSGAHMATFQESPHQEEKIPGLAQWHHTDDKVLSVVCPDAILQCQ